MTIKTDIKSNNLININEYSFKKLMDREASIREFGDRYEYCFISEYENKYDEFICDSIGIGDVFVQLLTVKGEQKLVSIEFPKELFDIEDIPNYLSLFDIKLLKNGEDKIYNAYEMIKALKFRGVPIVFYETGTDTIRIDLEELIEVTEEYKDSKYRINTSASKNRNSIKPVSKIFLNNEEINYVPEIKIDVSKDLIIGNGYMMMASFLGNYKGQLAFFKDRKDQEPISFIQDKETTVFIDIYNQDERKIVIVEHNYAIYLEDLE